MRKLKLKAWLDHTATKSKGKSAPWLCGTPALLKGKILNLNSEFSSTHKIFVSTCHVLSWELELDQLTE
jgi:hypothetical protein